MFAYIALFSWPLVIVALFKRFDLQTALILSILGGYLLLPVSTAVDLPVLPALNKTLVPDLFAGIMAFVVWNRLQSGKPGTAGPPGSLAALPGILPGSTIGRWLVILYLGGAIATGLTNRDNLAYGPTVLRGLGLYDTLSFAMTTGVGILTFLLARKYLSDPRTHLKILLIVCVLGLIYTLPALYEVRMSPQLNKMIYGFFPHDWKQHIRQGGFRPLVFLGHGLWLGIFLTSCTLAAIGYMRASDQENRKLYFFAAAWLMMTLVLSKNIGALLISMTFLPVILFTGVRVQLMIATTVALLVLSYPALRGAGLVPTEQAVEMARMIEDERARSLQFRFWNEDALLEKANEKPLFGWGGFGRSRIVDAQGRDTTIADGHWIITLGVGGWMRYIAEFGMLTFAIIILTFRQKHYQPTMATSVMCVMLAANTIDLLPNAGLTPLTWIMAGSLMGRLEFAKADLDEKADGPEPLRGRSSRYRRAQDKPDKVAPPGASVYTRQAKFSKRTNRLKS